MRNMPQLTVSGVGRQLGLRPSAIRYYERIGVLLPAQRDQWSEAPRRHGAPSARRHTESKANRLHSGRNKAPVLRFSQWHSSLQTMATTVAAKTCGT